jgi:hypothetical protein
MPFESASAALSLVQTRLVAAAILDVHLSDQDVTPVAERAGCTKDSDVLSYF